MLNTSFSPFPGLTTDRLILRSLDPNDAAEIFALRSDQRVNKYLNRKPAESIADATAFISHINDSVAKNESLYWAISTKGSDALIGTICLFGFSEDDQKCEIGYELLPEHQGQGIMQEAASAVVDYAINVINVREIEAWLHRHNAESIRLLDKMSFKRCGEIQSDDGDVICYTLHIPSIER